MEEASSRKLRIQWIGFVLGPVLAILSLLILPTEYELQSTDANNKATSTPASSQQPGSGIGILPIGQQSATGTDILPEEPPQNQVRPSTKRQFSWGGRATLAVMVWMGVWWLTEAIEISATALLPLVVFPLLGVADIKTAAQGYAHYLIFLYFGGFIIALSMERWLLGKRIALMTLKVIGTSAPMMILGFMIVTAFLSAFVSNTATTAMMLPIAISTIALLKAQGGSEEAGGQVDRFGTCLLLCIAYGASVGGIMTIIGTPTNAFLIGFLKDSIEAPYQMEFTFASWLPIGASLVLVLLPIMYLVMTKFLYPTGDVQLSGGSQMIEKELTKLGRVRRGEWITLAVFCCTILLWLTRPLLAKISFEWGGVPQKPLAGLTDTGVAMLAALALFLIPVDWKKREFTMDWKTANKMPWGILILFGGGLSLAAAVKANGVAEFMGSYAAQVGSMPLILSVLLVTTAIVFLTELTSNVATTTSLVPVLAAIAPGIDIHPYLLIIPATIAASCAFMLPVATPPNAIVFGSGEISLPQMVRAGFVLNLISLVVVTLLAILVIQPYLGL
ncbi:MAG: SLC13 family permease [Planctomycetota bacterium]